MIRVLSVALFAAPAVLAVQSAGAQQATPPASTRSDSVVAPIGGILVVTGTAEVHLQADRATIEIAIETHDDRATDAAAANARRVRAVLDTLHAMGISEAGATTASYAVQPQVVYDPKTRVPHNDGYVARNGVRVETRQLDQVGRLVDAALAAGANRVSGIRFMSSGLDSARDSALALAVAHARTRAAAMARAAGGRLGALVELTTERYAPAPGFIDRVQALRASTITSDVPPTPLTPGEQIVSATVLGRWRFVPGGGQ